MEPIKHNPALLENRSRKKRANKCVRKMDVREMGVEVNDLLATASHTGTTKAIFINMDDERYDRPFLLVVESMVVDKLHTSRALISRRNNDLGS